jgi:hypothetical protein
VKGGGVYNNRVVYPAADGYRLELATCVRCGELFLVDRENPLIGLQQVGRLGAGVPCPKCGNDLGECLRDYPANFVAGNGRLGSFSPPSWVPPDDESVVLEFWLLEPPAADLPRT